MGECGQRGEDQSDGEHPGFHDGPPAGVNGLSQFIEPLRPAGPELSERREESSQGPNFAQIARFPGNAFPKPPKKLPRAAKICEQPSNKPLSAWAKGPSLELSAED